MGPLAAALLTLLAATPRFTPAPNAGQDRLAYLYDLTSTTGRLQLSGGAMSWDDEARELYVARGDALSLFNEAGLETYRFADIGQLGQLAGVVPLRDGQLLLRVRREGKERLLRCDYRGRPHGELALSGLPPDLEGFTYGALQRSKEKLYFFDASNLRVVITTLEGAFVDLLDFHRMLEGQGLGEGDLETRGFWVDGKGVVYVGFPMLFQVVVVDGDGQRGFGQKGSTPGKFNVISAVAVDDDGYVYVADILKGAVLVFDQKFKFVGQVFGLTLPSSVFYAAGRVYIGQGGKAGVAVFEVRRR